MRESKYEYLGGTQLGPAEEELDAAIDRLQRVEGFLSSGQGDHLPPECVSLIESQRDALRIYARVLNTRIETFMEG